MRLPIHTIALLALPLAVHSLALRDLAAQIQKVVPAGNATVEGSITSAYPFGYTNPRFQQVWSGAAITASVGVVNSINYRMDGGIGAANPARNYTGVTIALGHTAMTPSTLSLTFASNVTASMTTVISGNYNLPAQPTPTSSPTPFNINFPVAQSYIYTPTLGDLLLDLTLPGAINKSNYIVDGEYAATGPAVGKVTAFGTSGSFANPEVFTFTADAQTLQPGGTLAFGCGTFQRSYAGSLVLGLSDKTWSGATLPLGLALIGAPNNSLYVSMNVTLPFNTAGSTAAHRSALSAPIPNSPVYSGVNFFAQAYYLDAMANSAGLVALHGLALTTAPSQSGPETNAVGHYDSTQLIGNFVYGPTRQGGPVTQFTGVF